jgi:hypothetical protein
VNYQTAQLLQQIKALRDATCLLETSLGNLVDTEELKEEVETLTAENARLKNHVIGQDRIIAELKQSKED